MPKAFHSTGGYGYERKPKNMEVIIIPYDYFNYGQTQRVYVEKGRESPDPRGLMMWGYAPDGGTVSDWKGKFTRAGAPIKIYYESYGNGITAAQERQDAVTAIRKFVEGGKTDA